MVVASGVIYGYNFLPAMACSLVIVLCILSAGSHCHHDRLVVLYLHLYRNEVPALHESSAASHAVC
jgi:hypothetical protein